MGLNAQMSMMRQYIEVILVKLGLEKLLFGEVAFEKGSIGIDKTLLHILTLHNKIVSVVNKTTPGQEHILEGLLYSWVKRKCDHWNNMKVVF